MIRIAIPGLGDYEISHLVLDLNGTIARDGKLLPGVAERLSLLRPSLEIHLVTANTYGSITPIDPSLGVVSLTITPGGESDQKGRYVRTIGAAKVAAIGNGANDVDMLRSAAIGIAVLGSEGLASGAHQAADILVRDICDALDLLRYPRRVVATLRR